MLKKISITTKSSDTHLMSVDTYTRWMCLVEAIQHINRQAEKSKINLDKDNKWIKPLSLQKYIKERFPSLKHDVKVEESLY